MEFWEYMDKVGSMHVGQGRKHPLHIEYIHMGILLGFIQDVMIEAIMSHPRLDMRRKTALIKAIGKVLWIQNGTGIPAYIFSNSCAWANIQMAIRPLREVVCP